MKLRHMFAVVIGLALLAGCSAGTPSTGDARDYFEMRLRAEVVFRAMHGCDSYQPGEEILVPVLVEKVLGLALDELGVRLVDIRSTGFTNVALLFDDKRIRERCAIVRPENFEDDGGHFKRLMASRIIPSNLTNAPAEAAHS